MSVINRFYKIILQVVCLFLSLVCYSQEIIHISLDSQLSPPLMGYNSDMSNTPKWGQKDFADALKKLHTNTLRYPGGSNSLYWDWETGWTISYKQLIPFLKKYHITHNNQFINDAKQLNRIAKENRTKNSFWRQIYRYNAKTPKYNTIDEFAKGIKATQSTAVFTLNITTSHLKKELKMLQKAKQLGIDVEYVELGNEIYANNLLTSAVYPSVDNYIDTCIKWSEAIWDEFPNAHIGVVGGDRNKRTRNWNEQLATSLKNHFPKVKHPFLHFILHYYSYFKEPKYNFNTDQGYKELIAFTKMDLQNVLKNTRWQQTDYFSTWVTEFNIIEQKPYKINNRWAHGLIVASQIDQLITQTETNMFHFHSIGAETFPVFAALHLMNKDEQYLSPTTSGVVTSVWNKLTENAHTFYKTKNNHKEWLITYPRKNAELPNNPRNETKIQFNPVHGYVSYDENKKPKLLVVNLSSNQLMLNVDKIIKKGHITQFFELPNKIDVNSRILHFLDTVNLPPYSINLLEE